MFNQYYFYENTRNVRATSFVLTITSSFNPKFTWISFFRVNTHLYNYFVIHLELPSPEFSFYYMIHHRCAWDTTQNSHIICCWEVIEFQSSVSLPPREQASWWLDHINLDQYDRVSSQSKLVLSLVCLGSGIISVYHVCTFVMSTGRLSTVLKCGIQAIGIPVRNLDTNKNRYWRLNNVSISHNIWLVSQK